jgi:hypothetical protein
MRNSLAASMLTLLFGSACQPEPTASADGVSTSTDAPAGVGTSAYTQESLLASAPSSPRTPAAASPAGVAGLSEAGIGPVKLGMSYAELVWAGLDPQPTDGGVAVGPYRVGFAPARGGPIVSVFVRLGDLPEGLQIDGKVLKNETTSLQELADAIGACEPIPPNIGQARTTCHDGRIEISGAGPVGGLLTITVKST